MNLEEFQKKYTYDKNENFINQHCRIEIRCDICSRKRQLTRWRAEDNIKNNGQYHCASCAMKINHKENPRGEETKEKQRQGRLGEKHTEDSKKLMSKAKLAYYKTPKGIANKEMLSRLTAKGHAENKFENTKRSGWYPSKKNDCMVYYSSSYELRLCWVLDQDDKVESYETQIEYQTGNRGRCLDCLVTYKDGTKLAIEVKPHSRLSEQANIDQINDSLIHAGFQKWNFEVYTELNFGMTERELRDWADILRTDLGDFDWVEFRKEKDREKGNRHYKNKISKEKTTFYCEYCKEEHTVLSITHRKNIKKNDRFICHNENAHKPKPKKKKVNPYAVEGKKQCAECDKIRIFLEFGLDKSRSDGYATRCKECRRKIANEKYQRTKNV